MLSLLDQLRAFAVTALGGVLMGVLFDCLRVVRGLAPRRTPLLWVLDLVYWVVLTPLMAGLLLQANWGELRLYVLLGIGTGLALYFAFGSRLVLGALLALSRGVLTLLSWAAHLVISLVTMPAALLRTLAVAAGAHRRAGQGGGSAGGWRPPWPVGFAWRRGLSLRPGLAWRRR